MMAAVQPIRLALVLLVACGPAHPPPSPGPITSTEPSPKDPPPAPQPPPAAKGVKQYDAATLFKNVNVVVGGFSHDGSKVLVSTNASGIYNLYAIPTAGGEPTRLTNSSE